MLPHALSSRCSLTTNVASLEFTESNVASGLAEHVFTDSSPSLSASVSPSDARLSLPPLVSAPFAGSAACCEDPGFAPACRSAWFADHAQNPRPAATNTMRTTMAMMIHLRLGFVCWGPSPSGCTGGTPPGSGAGGAYAAGGTEGTVWDGSPCVSSACAWALPCLPAGAGTGGIASGRRLPQCMQKFIKSSVGAPHDGQSRDAPAVGAWASRGSTFAPHDGQNRSFADNALPQC